LSFYQQKIEDENEIGGNKKLVFTQESNKQHELVVDCIYPGPDLIKDQHIDGFMFSYGFANRKNY